MSSNEATSPDSDVREAFLRDEISHLRVMTQNAIAEARSLERYALGLTGGVWAWLSTGKAVGIHWLAWWIPFLVSFLALLRVAALYFEVRGLAGYVAEREVAILGDKGGWETRARDGGFTAPFGSPPYRVPIGAALLWVLLLAVTAVVPVWLGPA